MRLRLVLALRYRWKASNSLPPRSGAEAEKTENKAGRSVTSLCFRRGAAYVMQSELARRVWRAGRPRAGQTALAEVSSLATTPFLRLSKVARRCLVNPRHLKDTLYPHYAHTRDAGSCGRPQKNQRRALLSRLGARTSKLTRPTCFRI